MTNETIFLLGFLIFIGIVMALDLGVLSKTKIKNGRYFL
ncbi:integral membrane protein terc [Riemerella anatipestifer]|nr:integral membrane protein terc [Riemerella anatipestifer]